MENAMSLSALIFVTKRTFINGIKQMLSKKAASIAYIIIFGLMIFGSTSAFIGGEPSTFTSSKAGVFIFIITALMMTTLITSFFQSLSKFSLTVLPGDVQFLMTGPIKPSRLLIYLQLKQMGTLLGVSFIVVIQAPMLYSTLGLNMLQITLILIAWFTFMITSSAYFIFTYTLSFKYPNIRLFCKVSLILIVFFYLAIVAFTTYQRADMFEGFIAGVTQEAFLHVPIFGWYLSLFIGGLYGFSLLNYLHLFLILATTTLSLVYVVKTSTTDYYEEAIVTAEKYADLKAVMKEGKTGFDALNSANKKGARKVRHSFKGTYERALIDKEFLTLKKKAFFIFNLRSLILIGAAIAIPLIVPATDNVASLPLMIFMGICLYVLLLFTAQNQTSSELDRPFIYLIPAHHYKKLWAMSYNQALKLFLEVFIGAMIISILDNEFILNGVIVALIITAVGLIMMFTDNVATILFGSIHTAVLKIYAKMLLTMLSIMPSIVILIVFILLEWELTIALLISLLLTGIVLFALSIPASLTYKHQEFK